MSLCEQLSFLARTFAPVFIRHAGKEEKEKKKKKKKRVRAASSVVIIKAVQDTPRRRRRRRRHPVRAPEDKSQAKERLLNTRLSCVCVCVRKEKAPGKKKKEHRRFDIHYVNAADRERNKERNKYR